jgi:hypothetical protein
MTWGIGPQCGFHTSHYITSLKYANWFANVC